MEPAEEGNKSYGISSPTFRSEKEKQALHSRFNAQEGLIIVRVVPIATVNVASHGKVSKKFEVVVNRVNANPKIRVSLSVNSVQDSYKRIQATFEKTDRRNQMLPRLVEEVCEMDALVITVKAAREDIETKKEYKKKAAQKCYLQNERAVSELMTLRPGLDSLNVGSPVNDSSI